MPGPYGVGRDSALVETRWKLRHERGPLRELLALEHPALGRFTPAPRTELAAEDRRDKTAALGATVDTKDECLTTIKSVKARLEAANSTADINELVGALSEAIKFRDSVIDELKSLNETIQKARNIALAQMSTGASDDGEPGD
jgi:hypothetical protein